MKIDFKNWLKKELWIGKARQIKSLLLRLPKWLLIKHGHALDVAAVVLVMLFAFLIIAKALYFEPSGVISSPVAKNLLSVSSINRIVVWMEEREAESEKELEIPEGLFMPRL